jgi:YD repeat-containing protein
MPDGSRHVAYKKDGTMTKYITKDYRILDMGTPYVLTLTSGTKITFGQSAGFLDSRYPNHSAYLATKIEDTNGNAINIYYQNYNNTGNIVPNYVDDSVGRRVYFYYTTINNGLYLTRISGPGINIDYAYDPITSLYGAALLKSVSFPLGPPWEYTYNKTMMDLLTVKTTAGGVLTYTYDFSSISACGWNFTYRTIKQKQNSGRDIPSGTWTFAYSQGTNSEYTNITDPCGRTIKYGFYGYGNSTLSTGSKWKYGLPKSKEIVGEETITYGWTNSAAVSADDYILAYCGRDYDIHVPLQTSQSITRGGKTYTTNYSNYDGYGNPQTISETGDKNRNRSISYWYNTSRNIVQNKPSSETVSGGFTGSFTTNYSYDTDGNLTQVNKHGVTTNYSYFGSGNLYSMTDANNRITSYQWSNGRISKITNPVYFISRSINSNGTIASETNGRGYTTSFTYDNNLRLTSINPPVGNTTTISYPSDNSYKKESRGGYYIYSYYDGFGRPTGTSDSKGVDTDIVYKSCGLKNYTDSNIGDKTYFDNFGRVTQILHKDTKHIDYSYSGSNVTVKDEDLKNTVLTYAAFGNPDEKLLVSVKDAALNTTSYDYNILGSLTNITQGTLSRTFSFNSKNFLTSETHPETGTTNYGRDNVGNMTSKSDASGTKNYTYDSLNRLTQVSYAGGYISFTYDKANNRTSMDNPSAAVDYTYDAVNRLTRKTEIIAGRTYTTDYEYDSNDNVTNLYYPSGRRVYHSYNSNNQVTGLDYFGARIGGAAYNTAGLPTSFTSYPGGRTTQITYNSRNLTTRINSDSANDVGYGYDSRGNTISMTNYKDSSKNQSFLYDSLNRLTGFDGAWNTGSYSYSSTGNRLSKTVGAPTTYSYSNNRLASSSGGETASFVYNGNGAPTDITWQGISYKLTYDPLNNLITYKQGATVLGDYSYDGDGLMVTKTSNGRTEVYHYDRGGRVISENDGAGNFIADYIYLK